MQVFRRQQKTLDNFDEMICIFNHKMRKDADYPYGAGIKLTVNGLEKEKYFPKPVFRITTDRSRFQPTGFYAG